jgi:hypothetical protein
MGKSTSTVSKWYNNIIQLYLATIDKIAILNRDRRDLNMPSKYYDHRKNFDIDVKVYCGF